MANVFIILELLLFLCSFFFSKIPISFNLSWKYQPSISEYIFELIWNLKSPIWLGLKRQKWKSNFKNQIILQHSSLLGWVLLETTQRCQPKLLQNPCLEPKQNPWNRFFSLKIRILGSEEFSSGKIWNN